MQVPDRTNTDTPMEYRGIPPESRFIPTTSRKKIPYVSRITHSSAGGRGSPLRFIRRRGKVGGVSCGAYGIPERPEWCFVPIGRAGPEIRFRCREGLKHALFAGLPDRRRNPIPTLTRTKLGTSKPGCQPVEKCQWTKII